MRNVRKHDAIDDLLAAKSTAVQDAKRDHTGGALDTTGRVDYFLTPRQAVAISYNPQLLVLV